mmetsp:Transcript_54343/g.137263  ORF Transcript_54343/g.137263 Transcript_54343/m.137263 type:complete len:211 (+) Transcript_54343:1639-2271(+)
MTNRSFPRSSSGAATVRRRRGGSTRHASRARAPLGTTTLTMSRSLRTRSCPLTRAATSAIRTTSLFVRSAEPLWSSGRMRHSRFAATPLSVEGVVDTVMLAESRARWNACRHREFCIAQLWSNASAFRNPRLHLATRQALPDSGSQRVANRVACPFRRTGAIRLNAWVRSISRYCFMESLTPRLRFVHCTHGRRLGFLRSPTSAIDFAFV